MELENQVCSLEIAKKLKELNCKQDSLWYWCVTGDFKTYELFNKRFQLVYGTKNYFKEKGIKYYSAFTCAELGEMLPDIYKITLSKYEEINVGLWELDKQWGKERLVNTFRAKTEANGRAECLIYLLENKLIDQGMLEI